ncbi:hypothetical protein MRB53_030346 [Persea americana]|uniref:Uncharacterized protein n=1 Tax=Persea americana TaxID=3435 RepID=A0ACC2KLC3_PERAE|nr:hypothetical protein MRB53_030346 [Persea americana]
MKLLLLPKGAMVVLQLDKRGGSTNPVALFSFLVLLVCSCEMVELLLLPKGAMVVLQLDKRGGSANPALKLVCDEEVDVLGGEMKNTSDRRSPRFPNTDNQAIMKDTGVTWFGNVFASTERALVNSSYII